MCEIFGCRDRLLELVSVVHLSHFIYFLRFFLSGPDIYESF